ncbi:MAG: PadR family transcriptional regulator [Propionibacteriaceae bacterium]|nr:PadR family transcriptional regulator [Propionibacteriaceae bacterium]
MSLKHVILGLLHDEPLTGYDLRHRIAEAGLWSADQAQIYRTLAALTKAGLVTRHTVVQTDRPSQHPHEITETGRSELGSWLGRPLEQAPGPRETFDLRLWFGGLGSAADARSTLAERREELITLIDALTNVQRPGPDLASALRYAVQIRRLAHLRTELTWLDATDTVLAHLDSQVPTRLPHSDNESNDQTNHPSSKDERP